MLGAEASAGDWGRAIGFGLAMLGVVAWILRGAKRSRRDDGPTQDEISTGAVCQSCHQPFQVATGRRSTCLRCGG